MTTKVINGYSCDYCRKVYKNPLLADGCEKAHKLIYVPIPKEDLMRLINFIYNPDPALLPERLIETLLKYSRAKVIDDEKE